MKAREETVIPQPHGDEVPSYLGNVTLLCLCGTPLSLSLTQNKHVSTCPSCKDQVTTILLGPDESNDPDAITVFAEKPGDVGAYEMLLPETKTDVERVFPLSDEEYRFDTYEGFYNYWAHLNIPGYHYFEIGVSDGYLDSVPENDEVFGRYVKSKFEVYIGQTPVYRIGEIEHNIRRPGKPFSMYLNYLIVSSRMGGEWALHDGLCYLRWSPKRCTEGVAFSSTNRTLHRENDKLTELASAQMIVEKMGEQGEDLVDVLKHAIVSGSYPDPRPSIMPRSYHERLFPAKEIPLEEIRQLITKQREHFTEADMVVFDNTGDLVCFDFLPPNVAVSLHNNKEEILLMSTLASGMKKWFGLSQGFLLSSGTFYWWEGKESNSVSLSSIRRVFLNNGIIFINGRKTLFLSKGENLLADLLVRIAVLAGSRWHIEERWRRNAERGEL